MKEWSYSDVMSFGAESNAFWAAEMLVVRIGVLIQLQHGKLIQVGSVDAIGLK